MPVTPYRTNLFQDHKELYQQLCLVQQQSIAKNCPQIISISQEIDPIDPLAVLQTFNQNNLQLHTPQPLQFYWEAKRKNKAIVAIDSTTAFKFEGVNRFDKTQQFIESCLANTIMHGDLNLPLSGPHFFCSFTFFDQKININSPFPSTTVFLPRWQVALWKKTCVLVANVEVNPQINLKLLLERLGHELTTILNSRLHLLSNSVSVPQKFIQQFSANSDQFKSSVLSALKSIQMNQLRKIVLANTIDVISQQPFNLVNLLNNLRQRNPDSYVFSTSNGKGQNFIGASPERLISIYNHELATDALAGSAPRGKTVAEDTRLANRLLSSDKERREHQFVLDFITQRLSQLGLIFDIPPTPQLLKLSNIQHLWTPIQAKLLTNIHPLEIVAQLHPTPAVAGVPTQIAQEQILALELFDRSLYAAPLGWVDYQGNCEFIVGIRSALIDSEISDQTHSNAYCAKLYAGAGIVAGSDPNKELAEIQLKLQVLLKALLY